MASSDSDNSTTKGWVRVNKNGEVENSDDGSSGSDFVSIDEVNQIACHHRAAVPPGTLSLEAQALNPHSGSNYVPKEEDEKQRLSEEQQSTSDSAESPESDDLYSMEQQQDIASESSCSIEELSLPCGETSQPEVASQGSADDSVTELSHTNTNEEVLEENKEVEEKMANTSQSSSTSTWEVTDHPQPIAAAATAARPKQKPLPLRVYLKKNSSETDSDNSDFVRLDPRLAEEVSHAGQDMMFRGPMQISGSSSSSISPSFRFVRLMEVAAHSHTDNDDDSVPSDVDDRCESDISGVAADDDSDLSDITFDIGDLPLHVGDVIRTYKHRPNTTLNAMLSTIALVSLFMAVGVGIGHYMGTGRGVDLRQQQANQMRVLQDDYLMCLRQKDLSDAKIRNNSQNAKIAAVTAVWKKKYEELILERVDLEQRVRELELQITNGMEQIQSQLAWQRKETTGMQEDLSVAQLESVEKAECSRNKYLLQEQQANQKKIVTTLTNQKARVSQLLHDLDRKAVDLNTTVTVLTEQLQTEISKKKNVSTESSQLKEQLKQLELDKSDLSNEISKLRSAVESCNSNKPAETDCQHLKEQLNYLANENSDLQFVVRKLRYGGRSGDEDVNNQEYWETEDTSKLEGLPSSQAKEQDVTDKMVHHHSKEPSSTSEETVKSVTADGIGHDTTVDVDIIEAKLDSLEKRFKDIKDQLQLEKGRSELWRSLYLGGKNDSQQSALVPSFLSCVGLLIPNITYVDVDHYVKDSFNSDTVKAFKEQFAFLENITADVQFSETLKTKWKEFQTYTESTELKDVAENAKQVIDDMNVIVLEKWETFRQYVLDGETIRKTVDTLTNKVTNITEPEKFQRMVNKTKETVSRLSETVQSAWHKVKNLSSDFLTKHHNVDKVGQKLAKKISKIGKHVQSELNHMKEKLNKVWFKTAPPKHKHSKSKHRSTDGKKDYKHQGFTSDHVKASDADPLEGSVIDETPYHKDRRFKLKPQHKQTQTSDTEQEQYAEFWKQAEFEPDDLIEEGFFEGNNREWRKQQRRLHKLHGRIQRLNEDIFMSMDEDDIDDIYDDLDDFEDDMEDEVQPERLKSWLTCQVRWWKSRLHRKHRTQDLIKGCGKQLMRWQLRILCRLPCKKDGRCMNTQHDTPFCQYYQQTVIDSQTKSPATDQLKRNGFHTSSSAADRPQDTSQMNKTVVEILVETNVKLNRARKLNNRKFSPPMQTVETQDEQDFEARWVFERASERDFERTKPWYFKRVREREERRYQLNRLYDQP